MKANPKIVWLSANLFGYEILKQALQIKSINISAIITLDPEASTKMYDGIAIHKWYEFNIPVCRIKKINDELELLKTLSPDFIIMSGWRQIISQEVIDLPLKGFIGFHPTLLPKGRGAAPIINTILAGWKKSGVTMFYINGDLDSGDII